MATLSYSEQKIAESYIGNFGGVNLYHRIYAALQNQDVTNNRSNVWIEHRIYSTADYVYSGSNSWSGTSNAFNWSGSGARTFTAGENVLNGNNGNVQHNPDGTGTLSGSAYINITSWGSSNTLGFSATIPTIPRASSVTSTANTLVNKKDFGVQVDFTITRATTSFTHTLEYTSGGTVYTIGTGLTTSASHTFSTDLISNYPSSENPTITVTCKTYNGATLIGTSATTVYLFVPTSYVPTCLLDVENGDLTSYMMGLWVKTRSKARCTIIANGVAGSTINSYSTVIDGIPYTSASFTSQRINTAGSMVITTTVTDTRGRIATSSRLISVIEYTIPTLSSIEVKRCLSDGTLDEDGTYGKVICTYAITPCNDGFQDNNSKTFSVTQSGTTKTFTLSSYSGTYTATDLFSGLSTTGTYAFTFTLGDDFYADGNAITQTVTMTPSYYTVSYKAGGKGVTFGRAATEDGFNCYMDADFKGEITQNGNPIGGENLPIGSIIAYPGDTAPNGWLLMGQNYSRTAYPELFAVIGTKFGAGDGSTTFGTNTKGRVFVGLDTSQTEFNVIGKIGGNKLLQKHRHDILYNNTQGYAIGYCSTPNTASLSPYNGRGFFTEEAGGGDSQNLQPYIVTNRIIKAFNVAATASTSTVVDNFNSESPTDSASANTVHILDSRSNYSTTEQIIGKWIDGKTIYRRVVNTGVVNTTPKELSSGITGIDNMIEIRGGGWMPTGQFLPWNFENAGGLSSIHYSNGNLVYYVSTAAYNLSRSHAILEYTKTTD